MKRKPDGLLDVYEANRLAALKPGATPETKWTAGVLGALLSMKADPNPKPLEDYAAEGERYQRQLQRAPLFRRLRERAERLATVLERDARRAGKATPSDTAALVALRVLEGSEELDAYLARQRLGRPLEARAAVAKAINRATKRAHASFDARKWSKSVTFSVLRALDVANADTVLTGRYKKRKPKPAEDPREPMWAELARDPAAIKVRAQRKRELELKRDRKSKAVKKSSPR